MGQALRKLTAADYPVVVQEPRKKVLAVKGLVKAYKSQHRVLDNINFELHAGEFVAIIGRSGAGKSTLLHILMVRSLPARVKLLIIMKMVIHKILRH